MPKKKPTASPTPSRAKSRNERGEILASAKLSPKKASALEALLKDVGDLVKGKAAAASFVSELSSYTADELSENLLKVKSALESDDAVSTRQKKPKAQYKINVKNEAVMACVCGLWYL